MFKDYNLNRHYVTKHEEKYQEHTGESDALSAKLQNQQGLFTKLHTPRDVAVKTSYVTFHKINKEVNHFLTGVCWTLLL